MPSLASTAFGVWRCAESRAILTDARYEDIENTPFTPNERAEIAEQLRQIKDLVGNTYSPSQAETLSIEAKLALRDGRMNTYSRSRPTPYSARSRRSDPHPHHR